VATAPLADPGARLVAAIVDWLVLGLATVPVILLGVAARQASEALAVAVFVAGYCAVFIALPARWAARAGASGPGKRLMKLHVVGVDGRDIGFRRGVLRTIVLILGSLPFYLGWLWMLWDPRRQAWHDKAARSLVVRREAVEATADPAAPTPVALAAPRGHCPVCGFELDADGGCRVCGRRAGQPG